MAAVESRPTLLIGVGSMGTNYARNLPDLGVPDSELSVVDIDPEKRDRFKADHPQASVGDELPLDPPERAIVVSNTPVHLQNLQDLSELSAPPKTLVEKPLFTVDQLATNKEILWPTLEKFEHGYTAYLINFSGAMDALTTFMTENNLVVVEGHGTWTKNRTGDNRPTAGDLEDEMTHQVGALLQLTSLNQSVVVLKVSAHLGNLSYVDESAQERLASLDASVPSNPNSSTSLILRAAIANQDYEPVISMYSSFTAPEQERRIVVQLSDGGLRPTHAAIITFDDPEQGGDILSLYEYPASNDRSKSKKLSSTVYDGADKLQKQIGAFLAASEGAPKPAALKTFREGLRMVDIARAAIRSNKLGGVSDFVLTAEDAVL